MIFKFHEGQSLLGTILAASPELTDPNFHQTLVFMVEHDAAGALGLVMNRPLGKKLRELSESDDLPEGLRDLVVFRGGPVRPTGLLLAWFERGKTDEELRCETFTDPQKLVALHQRRGWMRAFAGYAGWQEGQLESELRERAWLVCRPHTALMEEPVPPALWQAFVGEDQRWRKVHSLLPKARELN